MPTFEEVVAASTDKPAFSNGTEFEAWQDGWCLRPGAFCRHDTIDRGGDTSCPLMTVAVLDRLTPAQWVDRTSALGREMYRCTLYEAEAD